MKSSLVKVNYHSNTIRSVGLGRALNTGASVCIFPVFFPLMRDEVILSDGKDEPSLERN